jgi:NACHT domain
MRIIRQGPRRTGQITLILLGGVALTAVIVALRYRLGVASVLLSAVLATLPAVYLAWKTYSDQAEGNDARLSLADVANYFADSVSSQWKDEARLRRLFDPNPLPVEWTGADGALFDEDHAAFAAAGLGQRTDLRRRRRTDEAGSPPETGSVAADVFSRVPSRRMVMLGDPGAGKSALLILLVLALLDRRQPGGPVPFLVSLTSWDPARQGFREWLEAQAEISNPGLAAAAPTGFGALTRFRALLDHGLILPVLDGLDEIPEEWRGAAIANLNGSLRADEPVVITCRTDDFRRATSPTAGPEVRLRRAVGIELLPLGPRTVSSYLRADAGGPTAAARWDSVIRLLGSTAPVARALTTPLMVSLARSIYNPRPGERLDPGPDPAELCDPAFADHIAVERHLFDAFIPAVYRLGAAQGSPDGSRTWDEARAERWLEFLARYLETGIRVDNFAWWQLESALPTPVVGAVAGVASGLTLGLAAYLRFGVATALFTFATVCAVMGTIQSLPALYQPGKPHLKYTTPRRGLSWRPNNVLGFAAAAVMGIVIGLLAGLAPALCVAVAAVLASGLRGVPGDLRRAVSPGEVLVEDRRAAVLFAILFAVIGAVWLGGRLPVAGWLAVGLALGIVWSSDQSLWPWWAIARGWLALRGRLPWRLMKFLEDARRRDVLRQNGPYYQFRHRGLQQRLAERSAH